PDDVLLLNSLGFAHLRSGDVARAIELLERACALDGATAREHVNLAQAYAEAAKRQPGRRSDALAQLARAIQLDPDSWSAYSFQGFLHHGWQQRELALEAWKRAAEIDPDHVDTLINLALVQKELLRLDDAVATFERALEADPTSSRASVFLADLHGEMGRLQDAASVLHAALDVLLQIRGEEHAETRAVQGRLDEVRRRIAEEG
ncbi:MAG: tetratricopeptide repeat protein, partial [Planctomycetota bacterium]|nr:tetratricopeptide repeat protein [Planctomycetota bacterium]